MSEYSRHSQNVANGEHVENCTALSMVSQKQVHMREFAGTPDATYLSGINRKWVEEVTEWRKA